MDEDEALNEARTTAGRSLARSHQIVPVCRKFTVNYCVAISRRGPWFVDYLAYFHVFTRRADSE